MIAEDTAVVPKGSEAQQPPTEDGTPATAAAATAAREAGGAGGASLEPSTAEQAPKLEAALEPAPLRRVLPANAELKKPQRMSMNIASEVRRWQRVPGIAPVYMQRRTNLSSNWMAECGPRV